MGGETTRRVNLVLSTSEVGMDATYNKAIGLTNKLRVAHEKHAVATDTLKDKTKLWQRTNADLAKKSGDDRKPYLKLLKNIGQEITGLAGKSKEWGVLIERLEGNFDLLEKKAGKASRAGEADARKRKAAYDEIHKRETERAPKDDGRTDREMARQKKLAEGASRLLEKNKLLAASYKEAIDQLAAYRNSQKTAADRQKALIKVISQHQREMKQLNDKYSGLQSASSRLRGRNEALADSYRHQAGVVQDLNTETQKLNTQVERAEREASEYQVELMETSRAAGRARASHQEMREEIGRSRKQMKNMTDQAEKLRGRYDALKKRLSEVTSSKRALSRALESAQKKAARFSGVADTLEKSLGKLHGGLREVVKDHEVYTGSLHGAAKEARGMARDVATLMKSQKSKAKETKESTGAHNKYSRAIKNATGATKDGSDANEKYSLHAGQMRGATTGLRHALGSLRNTLLLITFAFGSLFYTVGQSIRAANEMESAMLGLSSVAKSTGQSILLTNDAAMELTNSGLLSVKEASEGLRNLLAAGFGMREATDMMNTLTDSAAFNRQGTLAMGQAIVGATQGIKNQNCLAYDTPIYDPVRKESRTIEEWHDDGIVPCVFSVNRETGELEVKQADYIHYNGEAEVFELELENGTKVQATANHRFLTQGGYKFLSDLDIENDVVYWVDEKALEAEISKQNSIVYNTDSSSVMYIDSNNKLSKEVESCKPMNSSVIWTDSKEDSEISAVDVLSAETVPQKTDEDVSGGGTSTSAPLSVSSSTPIINISKEARSLLAGLKFDAKSAEKASSKLADWWSLDGDDSVRKLAAIKVTDRNTLVKITRVILEELKSDATSVKSLLQLLQAPEIEGKSTAPVRVRRMLSVEIEEGRIILPGKEVALQNSGEVGSGENTSNSSVPFLPGTGFDVWCAMDLARTIIQFIIFSQSSNSQLSVPGLKMVSPFVKAATAESIKSISSTLMYCSSATPSQLRIVRITSAGLVPVYDLSITDSHSFTSLGIVQSQSIMVDNAGITKNLSIMYKEYAQTIGTSAGALSEAQKRQAIYNGILKEGAIFSGDAEKAAGTLAGTMSRLGVIVFSAQAAFGKELQPVLRDLVSWFAKVVAASVAWIEVNRGWIQQDFIGAIKSFAVVVSPVLGIIIDITTATLKWVSQNHELVLGLLAIAPALKIFGALKKGYLAIKFALLAVETVVTASTKAKLADNVATASTIRFNSLLAATTIQATIAQGGLAGALTKTSLASQTTNASLAAQIMTQRSLSIATIQSAMATSQFTVTAGAAAVTASGLTGVLGKLKLAMMSLFVGPQALFFLAVAAISALVYGLYQWYNASEKARESNLALAESQIKTNNTLQEQEARAGATAVAVRDLAESYLKLEKAAPSSRKGIPASERRGQETAAMAGIPTIQEPLSDTIRQNALEEQQRTHIEAMIRQMPHLADQLKGVGSGTEKVALVLERMNEASAAANTRLLDLQKTEFSLIKTTVFSSEAATELVGEFGKLETNQAVAEWAFSTGQSLKNVKKALSEPGTVEGAKAFEKFNVFVMKQLQALQAEGKNLEKIDAYKELFKQTSDYAQLTSRVLKPALEREAALLNLLPNNLKKITDAQDKLEVATGNGVKGLRQMTVTYRTASKDGKDFQETTKTTLQPIEKLKKSLAVLHADPNIKVLELTIKVEEPPWTEIYADLTKGWANASKKKGANAFALELTQEGTEARLQAELLVIGDIQKARIIAATTGELTLKAISDEANKRKVSAAVIIAEREKAIDGMAEDAKNKAHLSGQAAMDRRLLGSFTTLEQRKTAIAVRSALDRRKKVADIEALAGKTGEAAKGLVERVGPAFTTQAQVDLVKQTEQQITAALAAEMLDRRIGIIRRFNNGAATLDRLRAQVEISAANQATSFFEENITRQARRVEAEELLKIARYRAGAGALKAIDEEILEVRMSLYDLANSKITTIAELSAKERITILSEEQQRTIANLDATKSAYAQHYADLVSLAKAAALARLVDLRDTRATEAAAAAEGNAAAADEMIQQSKQIMDAQRRIAELDENMTRKFFNKRLEQEKEFRDKTNELALQNEFGEQIVREAKLASESAYFDRRLELMLKYGSEVQRIEAGLVLTTQEMAQQTVDALSQGLTNFLEKKEDTQWEARKREIKELEKLNQFEFKLMAVKLKAVQKAKADEQSIEKRAVKATKRLLAGGLEFYAKTISAELKLEAAKHAAKAVANAIALNWGKAAAEAAAAIKLGGSAVVIQGLGGAAARELGGSADSREATPTTSSSSGRGATRRVGGTIEARNLKITIAPSIHIEGENLYIGEGSVEALENSMGAMAVQALTDAVETNAVDLGEVINE